jgi:hypothetical protein
MNREFDRVDAVLASSTPGRALNFLDDAIRAAWRTSSTGATARSAGQALHDTPSAQLVRMIAIAVLIAVVMQPLLISVMPATVAPAMPWPAYALEALFAAAAAWKAESIVQAWPGSVLARWFRR